MALLLSIAGCTKQEEDAESSGPAKVAFAGKIDPALVGHWESPGKASILDLAKDGSAQIGSTFNTPKGKQSASHKGEWRIDADRLLLRYKESDGTDTTIGYTMNRSGEKLTLLTKSPKTETVYQRK